MYCSQMSGVLLIHCNTCGFSFYDPLPTEAQFDRFYQNYRDDHYQQQRQKYEKWYTKDLNSALEMDKIEIDCRKKNMSGLIEDNNIAIKKISSVLDFGGGRGQFIPDNFQDAEKYVYDVSGATLEYGVKRISQILDSDTKKFDFLMCCHVLEHVPDLIGLIEKMKRFSHDKTIFYFEVPVDTPIEKKIFHTFLDTHPKICRIYNAIRYNQYNENGFYVMHEHINHFTVSSLEKILISQGLHIDYISYVKLKTVAGNTIISCFATIENAS